MMQVFFEELLEKVRLISRGKITDPELSRKSLQELAADPIQAAKADMERLGIKMTTRQGEDTPDGKQRSKS